ncbi:hypothetical protein BDV95DRAFT_38868 [Massariosphaeria phaeospora]|uniref:RNA polymerase II degradation factor 1 n=1 Tax=Massariosphaeria phaeospora TaxID=100035 RepID=A0A7C8IBM8_9PLEO|nr:hypothetical protein BDV95DRAFT_38868 [Massariosphaeria phaeospora]
MSEAQSRPPRGRSSARGGRGAHGSRGPRGSKQTNGDNAASNIDTSADQGELGELKRRYLAQLTTLKELFPDWTDVDLVLAVEESDGDLQATIEKISEGNVSQFAEVKKAKDRSRSKVKDASAPAETPTLRGGGGRGARERGGDSIRSGRGRGTERGRGGFRGRGGASTNGPRGAPSVPTVESPAWDAPAAPAEDNTNNQATSGEQSAAAHVSESEPPKAASASSAAKTWASMFAKPKPAPATPKQAAQNPPPQQDPSPGPAETLAHDAAHEPAVEAEELPIPPVADEIAEEPSVALEDVAKLTPGEIGGDATSELNITPSKDELTKDNVEQVLDASMPAPTETAASTVASTKDIGSIAGIATPLSMSGQAPIGRLAVGGYATTALKATSGSHRSASFQRRLVEQHEAVVMPGNHAVDRAAVQFGSLGLGGDLDADSLDVDEDREDAETRTQPPQHSPVAQPRAALPPAPRQAAPTEMPIQESIPTPKQAPGLPPIPQHQAMSQSPSNPLGPQAMQNQGSQGNQPYNQFGRYGQTSMQSETAAPQQKPYDPFGQQAPQSSQYDYPNQQQNHNPSQQQQPQSQAGGFSSAPDSFSSQYLTSDQQRSAYQNYYQQYSHQNASSQQEAGSAQQRSGSAFGTGPNDSAFPQSQQQPQAQTRYNEAQNSGHTTPNPALGAQHPTGPASQSQHMHQPPSQPGPTGSYPYNHPYYGSPYYANYVNQFGNYGQQQGYGGFGGKGMYGQPHHYGMSPQNSFDQQHSSSPANVGGFGTSSMHARDSLAGGLNDYARSVSAASQNQHNPTAGAGGFGGLPEMFGRTQGGYTNQNSAYGQQGGQQGGNEDSLKPFDSKSGGPSPSALAQPGRPGSATNNAAGQSGQGGLPQQSHQQGFGGYPSHMNQLQQGGQQGSQYGGLGGLGHQGGGGGSHQQQSGGYGNYGGFSGYGSYNRGGWGGNYGGQH